MCCPSYKEDDHAGENIIADIKWLFAKLFGKKEAAAQAGMSGANATAGDALLQARSSCGD